MGEAYDPVERLQGAEGARDEVLGELFEDQRDRLRRMIHFRMDPRLKQRIDASDVIQDAWMEVARRIGDYLDDPKMPFHLWVRFIASQKLDQHYRFHVGAQKRSLKRQVSADKPVSAEASSVVMADALVSSRTTPTGHMARSDVKRRLLEALDAMEPLDREILVLRNFEGFSNQEAGQVLGLAATAASNRYVRALKRLSTILGEAGDDT